MFFATFPSFFLITTFQFSFYSINRHDNTGAVEPGKKGPSSSCCHAADIADQYCRAYCCADIEWKRKKTVALPAVTGTSLPQKNRSFPWRNWRQKSALCNDIKDKPLALPHVMNSDRGAKKYCRILIDGKKKKLVCSCFSWMCFQSIFKQN